MALTLSRRRFLQASVIASITSAQPGHTQTGSGKKIVVVGAGLAGLNTALILQRWGFDVTVVEARERVGGRLWTLDHVLGSPEGGGNVIGANYGRVIHTAHELDVPLRTPARTLPSDYVIGGQPIRRDQWATTDANPLPDDWRSTLPERLLARLNNRNPLLTTRAWHDPTLMATDEPADAGLRALGFPEAAIRLIDANNSYGNNLSETSLMALYRVMGEFGRLTGPGLAIHEATAGNMRIPEAMSRQLRQPVSMGDPVLSITQTRSGVKVSMASGKKVEADAAVLAVPAPALQQMVLGLPDSQADSIASIAYHKIIQLHCVAEQPFWEAAGWSGSWWTDGLLGRVFTRPIPGDHRYNMTVWINGDNCDALNAMSKADCTEAITKALWQLMPAAREVTEIGQLVRWSEDPFAGGSWALWRPGQAAQAHDAIRTPAGRLFFAGEHTAEAYRGMEAAMESGERAALQVMRALS